MAAEFRDGSGAMADPPRVSLILQSPDGVERPVTPERITSGRYEAWVDFDQVGRWRWHWHGEGVDAARNQRGEVVIRETRRQERAVLVAVDEKVVDRVRADFEPDEQAVATLGRAVVRRNSLRMNYRDRATVVVTDSRVFITVRTESMSHAVPPSSTTTCYPRSTVHVSRYKRGRVVRNQYANRNESALLDLKLPNREVLRLKITSPELWPSAGGVAETLSRRPTRS
jgi:hypothetical protein